MKCLCILCKIKTNHKVLYHYEALGDGIWVQSYKLQVIECSGCESKSFRLASKGVLSGLSEDGKDFSEKEFLFPSRIMLRTPIEAKWLPKEIWHVYFEVLSSLQNGIYLLSAAGIRTIVEGICKDNKAPHHTLGKNISWLESEGIISKDQADAMHTQRIFGNEAVHELTVPSEEELGAAMDIIDSVLTSIYVMPHKTKLQQNKRAIRRQKLT